MIVVSVNKVAMEIAKSVKMNKFMQQDAEIQYYIYMTSYNWECRFITKNQDLKLVSQVLVIYHNGPFNMFYFHYSLIASSNEAIMLLATAGIHQCCNNTWSLAKQVYGLVNVCNFQV
jgi:hypothetical protein